MAVNLPPQYHDAEAEYKRAATAEERLVALKKMWTILPKHKASEKVQAELKTKISETKDEVEREKKMPKKGGGLTFKFPRQGAGQVIIVGPPNAGKSSLLRKFTRATPEIAPYPFTTREPSAGMMDWQDVRVQLIDTPPITADVMEPFHGELVRAADAAVLMIDLADDDAPFTAEAVIEQLARVKKQLVGTVPPDGEPNVFYQKTLVVANKIDAEGAAERLEIVREVFEPRFPILVVSIERGDGIEELRDRLFGILNVMRIYTKEPGKPVDKTSPFTVPVGSSVSQMAGYVHADFEEKLKSARVWGTGVFDGQSVGRDHVLHDQDIVELHL